MLRVVLLSTDHFERSTAENIQNLPSIKNLDTLIKALNEEEKRDVVKKANSDEIIKVYPINDFITACNDGFVDLESSWITYVKFND